MYDKPIITDRDLKCAVINASSVSIILTNGCNAIREPGGNVNIRCGVGVPPAEAQRLAEWILGQYPTQS